MKKKVGIFLYNRLFDPVIQSNFWLYINECLEKDRSIKFFLITFEDPKHPLTASQQILVDRWMANGLQWKKLKWNKGTGMISKSVDIIQGFWAITSLRLHGVKHYLSLASIAGSYLYLYYLVLRFKYFLYQFEPHSEYAVDNRMWSKNSIHYKIAHYLERRSALRAKAIASGTRFMAHRLMKEWKVRARFFKIPTVANDRKFTFSQDARTNTREMLSFSPSDKVLFYPGKFGDLYYREEIPLMFRWLYEVDETFRFLIVTPHNDEEIVDLFNNAGVKRSIYRIIHADYVDIHNYYFAADLGIIAVPPGPSKKFISNIKVGEYLMSGLPFLITSGVSEDYQFALEKNVGVVVRDFTEQYIKTAYPTIRRFLEMDKKMLRERCRIAGIEYRGFENLNKTFKDAISYLCSHEI